MPQAAFVLDIFGAFDTRRNLRARLGQRDRRCAVFVVFSVRVPRAVATDVVHFLLQRPHSPIGCDLRRRVQPMSFKALYFLILKLSVGLDFFLRRGLRRAQFAVLARSTTSPTLPAVRNALIRQLPLRRASRHQVIALVSSLWNRLIRAVPRTLYAIGDNKGNRLGHFNTSLSSWTSLSFNPMAPSDTLRDISIGETHTIVLVSEFSDLITS